MEVKHIHWIAGFCEGEAYFGSSRTTPSIQVAQLNREPLDKMRELLGGKINTFSRKEVKGNGGGVYYRWYAYGARSAGVMMTLYPLLSKRRQFQIRKVFAIWLNDGKMSESDRAAFFKCGHRKDSEYIFINSRGYLSCRICTREQHNRSQRRIRALEKGSSV